jgi:cysteinyl-tRNA synthetase
MPLLDFFAVTENDKKKCAADFALWKFAKPGEPTWASPWGEGRPGWHIECSAMTHSIFGTRLDVHVGGIDLAFPHHCNEIAQCESFNGRQHEWVKVFLHTGHLFIEGQKMSKSLKNFTSIRDFLKEHDPNIFRMFIVQNLYRSSIHFSGDRVEEAKVNLSKFHHFFKAVEGRVRATKSSQSGSEGSSGRVTYWEDPEREFHSAVLLKKKDIRVALATDFNTPLALSELIKIVSLAQSYMTKRGTHVRLDVLQSCSLYVTSMLEMFGFHLGASDAHSTNNHAQGQGHGAEMEAAVIDSMLSFRKDVRLACLREKDPKEMKSKVLKLCDSVRNEVMPKLGVKVQDTADGNFIWVKEMEKPRE